MSAHESKTTDDHKVIKKWVEERDGYPSIVDTGDDDQKGGILRINFDDDDEDDEALKNISWEKFFKIFDDNNLDFLYQEKTKDGKTSRFCKFVDKE